jgi:hypothetical protein
MDWEVISDKLEVEPLINKNTGPIKLTETTDKEFESPESLESLESPESLESTEKPKRLIKTKNPSMKPSRQKIFQPTPSPAPLEKEESEEDSEEESTKEQPSSKKSSLIPFICIGFVMYLLSEYSKSSVMEKSL